MPSKPSSSSLPPTFPLRPLPPHRLRLRQPHFSLVGAMARKGSSPLHWLIFILAAAATIPTALSTDTDALLTVKAALSGPDTSLRGWSAGTLPCNHNHSDWTGVICLNGNVYGLQLENMSLSGALPVDALRGLPGLRTLSFMNNSLDGPMPDVGRLPALKSLYLSGNKLSGPIADGMFKGMRKLKKVYLSHNKLTGPVPSSLASLPWLLELGLDNNQFDGTLPDFQQPKLTVVNVANNNLEGPIPPALSKIKVSMFEGNENLCGPPLDVQCEPTTHLPVKKKFPKALLIALIVIPILVILAVLFLVLRRRGLQQTHPTDKPHNLEHSSDVDVLEQGSVDFGPASSTASTGTKRSAKDPDQVRLVFVKEDRERFELQDLLRSSAEVLGSGNFGASYKAILQEGSSVVVKRFKEMNGVGREDFQEHMRRLGRLAHPNLLPIVAYYYRKEEKLLVTDFVTNGSLAHMLHGNRGTSSLPPLDWPVRLKIVKGIARGLAYLYDTLPMLALPHGHLKSSNVLLTDSGEPLLTDYALIPVMNPSAAAHVMVAYKSPEVTSMGRVSKKSDVWSFGIMILEILTGKFPATYLQRGKGNVDLGGWVDSVVKEEWTGDVFDKEMGKGDDGEMVKLLHIGLGCCEADVEKRWEMTEVLERVEALREEGSGEKNSISSVSEADE